MALHMFPEFAHKRDRWRALVIKRTSGFLVGFVLVIVSSSATENLVFQTLFAALKATLSHSSHAVKNSFISGLDDSFQYAEPKEKNKPCCGMSRASLHKSCTMMKTEQSSTFQSEVCPAINSSYLRP
jgi:hypothetical protein